MPPSDRPILPNTAARRHFLAVHALIEPPSGPCRGASLTELVERLGFVQVDSVNTLARAHDLILWSRRQSYRPKALAWPLERDRTLFENWTHDAAVIPTRFFPYWRHKFAEERHYLARRWSEGRRQGFAEKFETILKHIEAHGPVTSADVGDGEARGSGGWWDWHPSKTALEYLWRTGALCVTKREGFRKHYDLTERVIPADVLAKHPSTEETIDWACSEALNRLGFATSGELAAFWRVVTPLEAKTWVERAIAAGRVDEIDVEGADGKLRRSVALPGLIDTPAPEPGPRVRILSPFDPALRDRARAERLFDFHYRIEIFVPEAQRRYGYYVFPVMEGDRLIGRIDMSADRAAATLDIRAYWPEARVRMGSGRQARLVAELERITRLAGVDDLRFSEGWLRG